MNVAYYTMAFDLAFDEFLDRYLDMGYDYCQQTRVGPFALQNNFIYTAELNKGELFYTRLRIMDYDHNKIHMFGQLFRDRDNQLSATWESLNVNVNLDSRKATPFAPVIQRNIRSVHGLTVDDPVPEEFGRVPGISHRST